MDDVQSNTRPCTNCGAALPLTGTYCLACDTPATDVTTGLSVAATHSVKNGKPIIGVALGAVGVVLVGALCFGLYEASRPHTDSNISYTVAKGMDLLARAESGTKGPCEKLNKYVEGPKTDYLSSCQALIGRDPGAHLTATKVTDVSLHGRSGTAHVHATLVDDTGKHTIDKDVTVHEKNVWHLVWDKQPLI